jgi:Ca2+-binding EF-hand superfamily protein
LLTAVKKETLIHIINVEFGLKLDVESLIRAIDEDDSGLVEYEEFKMLLSRQPNGPPGSESLPATSHEAEG